MRLVARFAAAGLVAALALTGCTSPREPSAPATPSTSASDDAGARAAALVARLDDAELVGQVLMPSVNMSDPGAADVVSKYRLGGVILMGDVRDTAAGGTAAEVRAFTDRLRAAAGGKVGLIVGTDQEYGWVTRIKSGLVQLP